MDNRKFRKPIRILIVGESGTGKTQFLSAIRAKKEFILRSTMASYPCKFELGTLVLKLQKLASNYSEQLSHNILIGIPWFVNRLFIRLVKTSHKERANFYLTLKNKNSYSLCDFNQGNRIYSNDLCTYMNSKNNFIVKHPFLGLISLDLLSILYKIKHRRK